VNAQHFVVRVCEQPGVDRDEILGAGLRGARLGSSFLLRVEDIGRYLHKLAEEYSVDRNLERHDGKVVLFGKTSGKATRGVRYNVNSHRFLLVKNRRHFDDAHVHDRTSTTGRERSPHGACDRSPSSPLRPNWPSCSNCFVDNDDCHGLGSCMTSDARTQLANDGRNTCAPRELSLDCLDLGSVARIVEPNTLDTPYDRLVDEGPHAVSGCPHGSRPFEHVDDTVLDREDRLDLQDTSCDARCLADAPALDEVLHCADEKVEVRAWLHPVKHLDDVVGAGSALNKLDSLHDHEPESETCRPHIVEMDAPGIGLLGCNIRAVECSTHAG